MLGTETYGMGGTVAGGSDSFTWGQTASDNDVIVEIGDQGTLGSGLDYVITVGDLDLDTFSDIGTDILGSSDSTSSIPKHPTTTMPLTKTITARSTARATRGRAVRCQ